MEAAYYEQAVQGFRKLHCDKCLYLTEKSMRKERDISSGLKSYCSVEKKNPYPEQ